MPEFLQFTFSGLTVGAVYALVALGFTLIYNASDVINFAQGEFVMLGGMATCSSRCAGVPLPLAALLAIVCRPSSSASRSTASRSSRRAAPAPVALIIITIGASIFLRGAAQVVFDKRFHSLPPWFGNDADPLRRRRHPAAEPGGARRRASSSSCCCGLFIDRTMLGKAMVATAANRLAARLVGINTAPHRRALVRHFGGDRRGRPASWSRRSR